MKKWLRAIWVCMGLLFATMAQAAGQDDDLMARIKNTYKNTHAFTGEFSQTLLHKESGTSDKRSGLLIFQKPLQIRWQTFKPNEETLVITGNEIWDYLPDEEIVYRYPMSLAQDSRSIIQVITGQAALSEDFKINNMGEENSLAKYALYPKDPTPQMVEAYIWVDPKTGYIKRAKVIDFYGNENDLAFLTFSPAAKIGASQFQFSPPQGVEVEDRRDSQIQEKELFK